MTRHTAGMLVWIAAGIGAAALSLQGIPLRIELPPVPSEDAGPSSPTVDPSAQAAALLTYEEIVRANPFGADRTPPPVRYLPPELRVAQQPAQPSGEAAAPRLQLYGVATGPTGAVALIDANPSIPGAEIYRTGDLVSIYRLESISDTMVVLRGESGVRTLRLQSPTGRSQ